MQARMKNPALVIEEAIQPIQGLWAMAEKSGVPARTLHLIHARISQINSCSVCLDGGFRLAKRAGESDERLFTVAGWRHAPYFTEPERAALALAESVTRLLMRPNKLPSTPKARAAAPPGSLARTNGSRCFLAKPSCESMLSPLTPITSAPRATKSS